MILALAFAVVVAAADDPAPAPAPTNTAPAAAPVAAAEDEGEPRVESISRPVVDEANVLGEDVESALRQKIHAHLDESGVAIGVVIEQSLAGKPLGDVVASRIAALQEGFAKGKSAVIVVISINDRVMRISGDPALLDSGMLTDADINALTSNATKAFRAGDYKGGVTALVDGLIQKTPHAPPDRAFNIRVTLIAAAAIIALAIIAAFVVRRRKSA